MCELVCVCAGFTCECVCKFTCWLLTYEEGCKKARTHTYTHTDTHAHTHTRTHRDLVRRQVWGSVRGCQRVLQPEEQSRPVMGHTHRAFVMEA